MKVIRQIVNTSYSHLVVRRVVRDERSTWGVVVSGYPRLHPDMGEEYPRVYLPGIGDRYPSVCLLEVANKFVWLISVVRDYGGAVLRGESSMNPVSGEDGVDVAKIERSLVGVVRLSSIGTVTCRKMIKVVGDVGIDEPTNCERFRWLATREVGTYADNEEESHRHPCLEPQSAGGGSCHDAGFLVWRLGVFTDSKAHEIVYYSMSIERKRAQGGLLIWMAASLVSGFGLWWGVFDSIEQRTWDWRVRSVAPRSAHNPNVKIIAIDQSSLEYVSREMGLGWPWPRSLYNPILDYLATSGAKGIAFDLLFTEHSNEAHDDEQFSQKVGSSLPVVNAVALQRGGGDESPRDLNLFSERQDSSRAVIEPYLVGASRPTFTNAALPIAELLKTSAAFGNVTSSADEDQIVRHTQPGAYLGATPVLSLPFALYATSHGADGAGAWLREHQNPQGELLIRYYGPAQTFQTYSMSAVLSSAIRVAEGLEPRVPQSDFKDAYVLIGASAPGLLDLQGVPFDGAYPGVEVNATILSNILDRSFLRETSTFVAFVVSLIALALSCAAGLFLKRGSVGVQLLVLASWIGTCYLAAHLGWWLPMVATLVGLTFVPIGTSFLQYHLEGRQHRFIRKAFKHYMSPEVIEAIVKDPSTLRLGGERRELTIFFSDIQGFTGISERLPPDQLVRFLNRFLSEMSNIILESGGTLDKYQGDAIIAFWNAPLTVHDHRVRAVRAAVACQRRLQELASEFENDFGIRPRMRIGIHTGVVSVGNFGSDLRFNYTMIGDAANVASRLEGVNKVFGSYTIASEATRVAEIAGVVWRKLGRVKVVGRGEPVVIYEPVDSAIATDLVRDLTTYHDALSLFEEGKVREAHALFERLAHDPVSAAYRARIERMMSGGVSESPVWDVKEK